MFKKNFVFFCRIPEFELLFQNLKTFQAQVLLFCQYCPCTGRRQYRRTNTKTNGHTTTPTPHHHHQHPLITHKDIPPGVTNKQSFEDQEYCVCGVNNMLDMHTGYMILSGNLGRVHCINQTQASSNIIHRKPLLKLQAG